MSKTHPSLGAAGKAVDDRFGPARFLARAMKKVFPDHWSFLLGEIAMYSFIILVVTGVFLTFFFKPSMNGVVYHGSYVPLRGTRMSEAYDSTLHISFDVRGGLLMRQIHHWATLTFLAAIAVHMLRNFFTGAYRKPRELNWLIGVVLFILAILNGLFGYSLPDDQLSGTGLRILAGVIESLPIIGTYLLLLLFGGQYPGHDVIPRLFTLHVLIIPGILLLLIPLHAIVLTWRQTHTQFPAKGRTERTVQGYPFFPVFIAKTTALFLWVFGGMALLSTVFQINPIWLYGPYNPAAISAGAQPDWYLGFLEGALRIMPNWEINALGHTLPINVVIPALLVPGLLFTGLALYPFLERWITGDREIHHLLGRPPRRARPHRHRHGRRGLLRSAVGGRRQRRHRQHVPHPPVRHHLVLPHHHHHRAGARLYRCSADLHRPATPRPPRIHPRCRDRRHQTHPGRPLHRGETPPHRRTSRPPKGPPRTRCTPARQARRRPCPSQGSTPRREPLADPTQPRLHRRYRPTTPGPHPERRRKRSSRTPTDQIGQAAL